MRSKVSLRRHGRSSYRVSIHDISPYGCKIEFVERPELDERLWVKFEGLEALEGAVCWAEGFVAGVEFNRPIHSAVFERLLATLRNH